MPRSILLRECRLSNTYLKYQFCASARRLDSTSLGEVLLEEDFKQDIISIELLCIDIVPILGN